jgi:thioredoxin-like negative regulator of GroEL
MRAALLIAVLVAPVALVCASSEESAEQARAEIQQALEHGDRARALAAVDKLRDALPETPEALLEVSRLLVQAGDAPRAGWLLEETARGRGRSADPRRPRATPDRWLDRARRGAREPG